MIFKVIVALLLIGNALWTWSALRRARNVRPRWVGVFGVVFGFLQLAGLAIMLFSRSYLSDLSEAMPRWVMSAVLVWHLLILPFWLLFKGAAGISLLAKRIARVESRKQAPQVGDLSRREFIGAAAALTPPMISLGAAAVGEMQLDDFRVRRLVVPIPNLPPALEGLTLAHVTDSHVGRFTRGRVLERIVEETNRLDADFVAITGDLINDTLRAMPPAMEMVRGFRGRSGVIACEGNHDLLDNAATFYREAEKGGLPLLRNATATVTVRGHKVQFLGLPWNRDRAGQVRSIQELLAQRDPSALQIMLAHHPHAWDDAPDVPLTLAGHTHGGQLMLSERAGAGPMIYKYWSGLYTRNTGALVVSNGVGNWFPVRIHAPAEIVHLTLRSATAASASSSPKSAGSSSAVSGGGARI